MLAYRLVCGSENNNLIKFTHFCKELGREWSCLEYQFWNHNRNFLICGIATVNAPKFDDDLLIMLPLDFFIEVDQCFIEVQYKGILSIASTGRKEGRRDILLYLSERLFSPSDFLVLIRVVVTDQRELLRYTRQILLFCFFKTLTLILLLNKVHLLDHLFLHLFKIQRIALLKNYLLKAGKCVKICRVFVHNFSETFLKQSYLSLYSFSKV